MRLFLPSLIILGSCGLENDDAGFSQRSEGSISTKNTQVSYAITDISELTECNEFNQGHLAYVSSIQEFRKCNLGQWEEIEINGKATISKISDEPKGEHCLEGGKKIETGIDHNTDFILDADELVAVNFICNGLVGQRGLSGEAGPQGVAGADGMHGQDGVDGADGAKGEKGDLLQVPEAANLGSLMSNYFAEGLARNPSLDSSMLKPKLDEFFANLSENKRLNRAKALIYEKQLISLARNPSLEEGINSLSTSAISFLSSLDGKNRDCLDFMVNFADAAGGLIQGYARNPSLIEEMKTAFMTFLPGISNMSPSCSYDSSLLTEFTPTSP